HRPPRLKTAHEPGKIEKWRKSSLGNTNRSRADRRAVGPLAGEPDPMSDAQTHFVAVCPHCAGQLKIRRGYLGPAVRCKHCAQTFQAEEPPAAAPATPASGEGEAGTAIHPWPKKDRIVVTCPSCNDSLRVRREYIGQTVQCKRCGHAFAVTAPAEAQPDPAATIPEPSPDATAAEYERLAGANLRLHAAWEQLQAEHQRLASEHQQLRDREGLLAAESQKLLDEQDQLEAEHARLKTDHGRIQQRLDQVTTELESV